MDKNKFWKFENNVATPSEATLYVYGEIINYDLGNWNFPDDVVPNKFKNELNELGDVETIHVRINSSGGSVFAAYAIMNLLKTHKAKIITYNDGIAASAATIIAMAGDKIITALGSVWMVHLPSTGLWGNATDFKKAIEVLDTITESMIDIYNKRTNIARDTLLQMLKEDTWLTGTEALEKGFADEITELEVVAYLNDDKKTAFFNGQKISLENISNKNFLLNTLPPKPHIKNKNNPKNVENKTEEKRKIMNLEELKAKYPNIYSEAVNVGISSERERLKEIDNLSLTGMEELTNKAKYETGITAEAFAMELIKAQKEKGINFLNQAKSDADHLNNVPSTPTLQNGDEEEEAILAQMGERAKNLR